MIADNSAPFNRPIISSDPRQILRLLAPLELLKVQALIRSGKRFQYELPEKGIRIFSAGDGAVGGELYEVDGRGDA